MIIFDTETTGITKTSIIDLSKQPKIIEFAAIKLDDKTLEEIDRIDFLVNPEMQIPAGASKVNGIYNKDVDGQKTFSSHFGELAKFFLGEKFLIAHNLEFDINMLKYELMRIGREAQFPFPPAQICTVNKTFHINNYRLSLGKLYQHLFNEELQNAHRAMGDVESLTRCVKELIKKEIILIR